MTSSPDTATVETRLMNSLQSVLDRYCANLRAIEAAHGPGSVETLVLTVSDLIDHRSRYSGWKPEGLRNASGSCRLMPTVDARWVAVNLARRRDVELLAVVLGLDSDDLWSTIEAAISTWRADDLLVAVSDLGLPLSVVGEVQWLGSLAELPVHHRQVVKNFDDRTPTAPVTMSSKIMTSKIMTSRRPRVVDLSSLWAGPLCSRLLVAAGFEVTTIESASRRDPTRDQHPQFHEELHRGKEQVTFDFAVESDRRRLRELLESSDVVIEGSRRRALTQIGIDIDDVLAQGQPRVWVSITGYGYRGPSESRVGFGDDCAVAGGLVGWERVQGDLLPRFVGDAVADPITGLVAATAVLDCLGPNFGAKITDPRAHHLQISLAEAANWVSRGGTAANDQRDCRDEGRL